MMMKCSPIIYLVPTSGEFYHPGSEALGDLEPETRTRIIRDSAAITHDPALTDGKGSTLMEEDIEGLGHGKRFDMYGGEYRGLGAEDIFILHKDHRPTSLIDTWEFCKDYKESGNFQIGVLVSPRDLELLDLNISPLEVVENAEH